jgi:hypothetical protein
VSAVVVQFDPYTKTGNRLCQFAFGKLLALQKDVTFSSLPIPGFKNTYNNNIGITPTAEIIKTLNYGAHTVNYNQLLTTQNTVLINSYLQKYVYYAQHLDFLRNLFVIENSPPIQTDENELVIHIRGTDYRDGNVHIDDELYFNILQKIAPKKASIVTDDINIDIVKKLYNHDNNISVITQSNLTNKGNGFNEHEIYDFVYMLNAKNLLISQSTFSWWAAFLGHQTNVYVPYIKSKNCMWKLNPERDDIDLIPNDNSKFIKLIYD